jgi:hypothetical protein
VRLVIVESPFAGQGTTPEARAISAARNRRYLTACLRDCLLRGEAPFASHGLYPGALDDDLPEERKLGMAAGFVWRRVATLTVVYMDLGVSRGMLAGIEDAQRCGCPLDQRRLGDGWDS